VAASTDPPGVAIVTGAAGGLGPACCEALARRGHHVVAADLDLDGAERVARQLGDATAAHLDVTDAGSVRDLAERFARIDVLVNLAGVIRRAPLAKIEVGDFRLVLATHVEGTLNTMQAVVPIMRANGYGRIVNTSSIAVRGTVAGGSYGSAKGAVEALTRSVAMELAPAGITVNCVAPGLVDAGMFLSTPEDYRVELAGRVPMQRLADPSEIAACVAFLGSREAGYVTGQTLTVCGGLTLGF
jgi:3-oxoacyl-[acyl-carrier protein] reductase